MSDNSIVIDVENELYRSTFFSFSIQSSGNSGQGKSVEKEKKQTRQISLGEWFQNSSRVKDVEEKQEQTPQITLSERLGLSDFFSAKVWKTSLAELMASAILIFLNSTIAISTVETNIGGAPILIMSILMGTTIAFLVLAILPISGGHLSPVISLSAGLMGLISLSRASIYIFAQCIGGVLGALALKVVLTSDIESKYSLGGCTIGELGLTQAFYIELICAFVYLFALRWIAFDIEKAKKFGGIVVSAAIGIIVGINIFISSTVTGVKGYSGAGMNPARCLGPAIVRGGELWNGHWIFWVAPTMASVVFFTCTRIISDDHLQPNENIHELGNILKALALQLRS